MKRFIKRIIILMFILINLLPFQTGVAQAAQSGIVIDGYYDDWSDKPYSWEYNWNNPYIIYNYWDGSQNITKTYLDENGNPYNLEIRHRMSLYSDGEYVYLYIQTANQFGSGFNGEDYQFWFDNQMAAFRVTLMGGSTIGGISNLPEGNHYVEIRHRNGSISNSVVNGAQAFLTKRPDNKNNQLELMIPVSAMTEQNPRINTDTVNTISFFTPNLMYRRIACSGVSTGPVIGLALSAITVGGVFLWNKRKIRSKQV